MGMFDYVRVLCPLPEGAPSYGWQTKDTPEQYLSLYEIREDGSLWHCPIDGEPGTQEMLTGAVNFYTYADSHKVRATWWEFCALYDQGKLLALREVDTPNTRAMEGRDG